ncbi:MAG: alpha/beta hydrolase-fold protein [Gammaproteobacteria bacterium]|jgi:predicted peptidase
MRALFVLAVGLMFVTSAAPVRAQEIVTRAGTHELTLPGSGRRYTLVVPRGYRSAESVPLIVSLHFGGRVTPWIGRSLLEQLIEPALDELGAIIVAPDSAASGWANATAEQHVLELVEYIEAHYKIDRDKTLLTGYSMGAMGTWYLAPRHPELFEAAVPIAGRPQSDVARLDWRTPTWVLNSAADEVIPIEPARAAVEALRVRGAPVEMTVVEGITHFQIPRYRRHLRDVIPWIERVWNDQGA